MAVFRTRDELDARRFVRALLERGFRRVPARRGRGGLVARDSFRVSPRRRGWITVCYYEPSTRRPIPAPDPVSRKGANQHRHPLKGSPCVTPGCGDLARSRGLCGRCWTRWLYWKDREAAS